MRHFLAVALGFIVWTTTLGSAVAQDTSAANRKIVSKVLPSYPELATKMNIEGTVKLEVTVAANGRATNVQVIGGNPVLVKSAEDAVYKYRWAPAPQESKEPVEFRFRRPGS